jgi:seryl-tRNA synthetase
MNCNSTSAPVRSGTELETLAHVDRLIVDMATSIGGQERQYPALISREALVAADYPSAFPHLLVAAAPLRFPAGDPASLLERENLARPAWFLSPAVCYHVYAEMAASELPRPAVITARGRCFRHEAALRPGIRQLEFEMREIVLAGPREWVEESARVAQMRLESLARSLGLDGTWEIAEDPFFLPAATAKALLQRLRETKLEYQSRASEAVGLALASINRHGRFFGERFGIVDQSGQPIHTACVAVGLDRWLSHMNPFSRSEVNHVAQSR